jgi:transcriptional regulator with XRE-family HTH domain
LGRKLRALRNERAWHQDHVAAKLKLSVGTIHAAEHNKWKVGIENLEKYAGLFGLTVRKVLHPDEERNAATIDPLIADLNQEHLGIARQYMRALNRQRQAVECLLQDTSDAVVLAQMVLTVKLDPALVEMFGGLVFRGDLLTRLAKRLEHDPKFEQSLREQLVSLAEFPVPPPEAPPAKREPNPKK